MQFALYFTSVCTETFHLSLSHSLSCGDIYCDKLTLWKSLMIHCREICNVCGCDACLVLWLRNVDFLKNIIFNISRERTGR